MKKTIGFLILLPIFIFLSAALIWMDFHVATSQFTIESQVSTYGYKGQASEKLPHKLPVKIYVEGNDLFSKALRDKLSQHLETNPHFNQASILSSLPGNSSESLLLIEPVGPKPLWTPVYTKSQFKVHLIFASDGDISWRNDPVVRMNSSNVQVVRISADFDVKDTSFGLISRIYYHKYLAEKVASQIIESLSSSLDAQTN